MNRPRSTNNLVLFLVVAAIALLTTYLFSSFSSRLQILLGQRMSAHPSPETIVNALYLLLLGVLAYLFVRALNSLIFGLVFRLRRGFEAPVLVRNIFSIIAFALLLLLAFTQLFPKVDLGALFTTSAIFGVILGLALQDTLGNFFAGISLQADRPFQVGDVITVGEQRHTGVVEEITWRALARNKGPNLSKSCGFD